MSQVTDPVLLDNTGQNIVAGISAVVSAIQSRGMPSPSASNPQMDGTASPGTSNDYARGDHVHPENPANAKTEQLAYVETGTTASRNYSAGEYICWNGLTYTADTNIATGTTLSASGGNKTLTECVGGGLNYLSGGMRFAEYLNLQFTFSNSQASQTKSISSIDPAMSNAKAVLAWCTSQGTPIFPYINTARTVIGVYSPSGSLNTTITVRLIAIY